MIFLREKQFIKKKKQFIFEGGVALSLGMEEFPGREGCALAIHKHSKPPQPADTRAGVCGQGRRSPPSRATTLWREPMDLGERLGDLTPTTDFQRLPEPGVGLQDPVRGPSGPQVCADALVGVGGPH